MFPSETKTKSEGGGLYFSFLLESIFVWDRTFIFATKLKSVHAGAAQQANLHVVNRD